MANMGATPAYAYADLHRFVIVDVTGPSEPLLNQEIQRATAKFIRLSECWRETLDLGNLTSGYTFDFTYPTNGLTGVDLVTYSAFPKIPLLWVKVDGIEIKRQFYRVNNPTVKDGPYQLEFLEPYDDVGQGEVTVRVAWRLRFDADPAPEWIYSQYGDIIATIARGALLTAVNKPWSSKDEGKDVAMQGVNQAHRVLAEMRMADPMEFRP
jgi:hypothetical protein